MMALTLLRPFAKPILYLLICVACIVAIYFFIQEQQKIGALEQAVSEKQQQLEQQQNSIRTIQTQVQQQQQNIVELQKVQTELQAKSEQRQITLKEIFTHDEPSKSWAVQPVPDAIRSMFNTGATSEYSATVSSAHPLQ
jgi:LysB family phage lysis regulatory protein